MLESLIVLTALITGTSLLFFKEKRSIELVHFAGTLLVVGLTILFLYMPSHPPNAFWINDALSKYFSAIIAVVYVLAGTFSVRYLLPKYIEGKITLEKLKSYYCYFHLFAATMFATVLLNNLGLMWVAIELSTLTSAILVGFYNNKASLEAAWKYIFLCSVGIALALFGIILVFYSTEGALGSGTSALNWSILMDNAAKLNPQIIKLAFIFIFIGFGTKIGLAPMHSWLPDTYSQAPAPISAMLSGVFVNCVLYGVLRMQIITNAVLGDGQFTSKILIAFGIFTLLVALPFLVAQNDVKRLLAYSSVEHVGLITIAFGIGTKIAVFGALLHALFHALAKAGLFFAVGDITNHWHTKKLARIKGVAKIFPVQGWATFLALFALAGSPPFGIFRSELLILTSAIESGRWFLAGVILLAISIAFAGLVFHFGKILTGNVSKLIKKESYIQPFFVIIPLSLLLVMGLWVPEFLTNAVSAAGKVLLGGNM